MWSFGPLMHDVAFMNKIGSTGNAIQARLLLTPRAIL
jgi:hypothetical protein